MTPVERERQREYKMIKGGVERWEAHRGRLETKGKQWDSQPNSEILRAMVVDFLPHTKHIRSIARAKFKAHLQGGNRLAGWEVDFLTLDPVVVSYVALKTVLQYQSGAQRHVLAKAIGETLRLQIQMDSMVSEERARSKDEGRRNRIEDLKSTVKEIGPRTIRKWIKRLDDLETVDWDYQTQLNIGMLVVDELNKLTNWVKVESRVETTNYGRRKHVIEVRLLDEHLAKIREQGYAMALATPWLQPMVCPPRDWERDGTGGGYLEINHALVKHGSFEAIPDEAFSAPEEVLEALNRIQRVPWRINTKVLKVAREAAARGLGDLLPVSPVKALPPPIPDTEWKGLDRQERGVINSQRQAIHSHNNRLQAHRDAMVRVLAIAEMYADEDSVYFPHNLDWRGRVYPLPQDLHPQGDDLCRGLLEFREGKPVTHEAFGWICHAAAAAYGYDKLSLSEQKDWVLDNIVEITRATSHPLDEGLGFLAKAEDVWQFLAAAYDIVGYLTSIDYVSHLAVHVDGSCNGLQHLSAMGRDPVGAVAVNLGAEDTRQDIYQIVADKVIEKIARDREEIPEAANWEGRVTRKTVKRAVMTTPYGVTYAGIRQQLVDDRMVDDIPGDRMANANYMRDCLVETINASVVEARRIMQWMQDVASELAQQDKPVVWTSPTGLRCRQEYRNPKERRLSTLMGRVRYYERDRAGKIKRLKAAHAIAPNIVHSFDAAHLVKVVNGMPDGSAMTLVHDSYGTHAADIPRMSQVLRETFVSIYSEDWLIQYAREWAADLGYKVEDGQIEDEGEWVYPPEAGLFDITQCLSSPWMFF